MLVGQHLAYLVRAFAVHGHGKDAIYNCRGFRVNDPLVLVVRRVAEKLDSIFPDGILQPDKGYKIRPLFISQTKFNFNGETLTEALKRTFENRGAVRAGYDLRK